MKLQNWYPKGCLEWCPLIYGHSQRENGTGPSRNGDQSMDRIRILRGVRGLMASVAGGSSSVTLIPGIEGAGPHDFAVHERSLTVAVVLLLRGALLSLLWFKRKV
jgi:hypothetical protein